MANISDITAIERLMNGVSGERLDVQALLSERRLASWFEDDIADSSCLAYQNDPTSRNLMHRATGEQTFVLTPKPKIPPVVRQFAKEQVYEGTVIAVNPRDRMFTARVADINGDAPDEEGEFSLDELNGDEQLVVPGALFTWTIGLQSRGSTHQRIRVSDIRFRRIAPVTHEVIEAAEKSAQELSSFLLATEMADPIIDTI